VSNRPLRDLVAWADAADVAIHTLEVSVAGRVVSRSGIPPFGLDVPHRMYSVSKSLTGLAVLLLVEEGRLRLTDSVAAHFPDMAPVHPWIEATRIDDILAMTGPHSRTTYDEGAGGWLESYFRVPPTHRPGTLFTYDTSGSYVLSALVERLSGMPLLEYLRPRLLDPLGVGMTARFLTGPEGISHGGSGLIMAPGDLLPLAEVLNGGGCRNGARVLSENVVAQLLERRSDPATQTWGGALRAGYGRQVWLPGGGAWMMFGLGGQIVYGHPARKLAAVVTADTSTLVGGDQRFAEMLLQALATAPDAVELAPPTPAHDPAHADEIRSAFALTTGEDAPAEVAVSVDADGGLVRWGAAAELEFTTSGPTVARLPLGDAVITAGWSSPGVLDIRVSAVGADIASVRLRLVSTQDDVLTVMSQGFGPAIDASWTWRGSYRRASSPA
jgi:CubicO group peptidase (beta-lactamase class C family)